jgi:hypothetical protein
MVNDPNTAYYSKEVRRFFPEYPNARKPWFAENKFSFDGDQQRMDHYLDMRPQKNISWKIREGRTEIKLQLGDDTVFSFPNGHSSIVNRWVKWSLPLKMKIERPDILYDKVFKNTAC